MRRVTAVDMDGNVIQREDERIGHNELVYEINEVGEYTFTITVQDEHNNIDTRDFTFSIHDE